MKHIHTSNGFSFSSAEPRLLKLHTVNLPPPGDSSGTERVELPSATRMEFQEKDFPPKETFIAFQRADDSVATEAQTQLARGVFIYKDAFGQFKFCRSLFEQVKQNAEMREKSADFRSRFTNAVKKRNQLLADLTKRAEFIGNGKTANNQVKEVVAGNRDAFLTLRTELQQKFEGIRQEMLQNDEAQYRLMGDVEQTLLTYEAKMNNAVEDIKKISVGHKASTEQAVQVLGERREKTFNDAAVKRAQDSFRIAQEELEAAQKANTELIVEVPEDVAKLRTDADAAKSDFQEKETAAKEAEAKPELVKAKALIKELKTMEESATKLEEQSATLKDEVDEEKATDSYKKKEAAVKGKREEITRSAEEVYRDRKSKAFISLAGLVNGKGDEKLLDIIQRFSVAGVPANPSNLKAFGDTALREISVLPGVDSSKVTKIQNVLSVLTSDVNKIMDENAKKLAAADAPLRSVTDKEKRIAEMETEAKDKRSIAVLRKGKVRYINAETSVADAVEKRAVANEAQRFFTEKEIQASAEESKYAPAVAKKKELNERAAKAREARDQARADRDAIVEKVKPAEEEKATYEENLLATVRMIEREGSYRFWHLRDQPDAHERFVTLLKQRTDLLHELVFREKDAGAVKPDHLEMYRNAVRREAKYLTKSDEEKVKNADRITELRKFWTDLTSIT